LRAVNGSGFAPRSDAEHCSGCSRCARACPVAAVEMVPARRPADRKNALAPRFDLDTCIGCGVCATACHKGALHMERGGQRRPVPKNPVEKAVRQALERNRLAELLFDGGEGLGNRFLRQATRAITSLPPAKQLLATEQVRSRFVKAAMARFKDG
jgi:ferredoxin